MQERTKDVIKEFQDRNCHGCVYADKQVVGTGNPACTFPGRPVVAEGGICKTRTESD